MATATQIKKHLQVLKAEYESLKIGKDSLLHMIDEAETAESVYNSNAIENSTLTLKETEKILLQMEVSRDISLREVFEAKNLATVMEYVRQKTKEVELSKELILLVHKMLMGNIKEAIAGQFRKKGEYVRIGTHIAPAPEHVERLIESILIDYASNLNSYFIDKIAKFHLDFETIHPFLDGNGRIGRVLINYQLFCLGFPAIIIRDKEKKQYYQGFVEYRDDKKTKIMEQVLTLALTEALHKRITYLKGEKIITVVEYAKKINKPAAAILNMARRQTIAAFREKGVWKIGQSQI